MKKFLIYKRRLLLLLITAFLFNNIAIASDSSDYCTTMLVLDECTDLSIKNDNQQVIFFSDSICTVDCEDWRDGVYSAYQNSEFIFEFEIKDGIITNRSYRNLQYTSNI